MIVASWSTVAIFSLAHRLPSTPTNFPFTCPNPSSGPFSSGIYALAPNSSCIPEAFLRGAGVPEDFITYMKSLAGNPIEFYSCFISYSSHDDEFATPARRPATEQGALLVCARGLEDWRQVPHAHRRVDSRLRQADGDPDGAFPRQPVGGGRGGGGSRSGAEAAGQTPCCFPFAWTMQ